MTVTADSELITFPPAPGSGDKTLVRFLQAQIADLKEAHHELLNDVARAITERGWVQPIDAILGKLVDQAGLQRDKLEAALGDLVRRRLLTLDAAGQRVVALLGCFSLARSEHRAHLASGIDVFTFGGADLLTVNSALVQPVDVFSRCPVTGRELKLVIADEAVVEASPIGIAGFIADWDGRSPLEALSANSPLFASDEAMAQWVAAHPELKGTELSADLLLWVGMEGAKRLGALRFKLIGLSV